MTPVILTRAVCLFKRPALMLILAILVLAFMAPVSTVNTMLHPPLVYAVVNVRTPNLAKLRHVLTTNVLTFPLFAMIRILVLMNTAIPLRIPVLLRSWSVQTTVTSVLLSVASRMKEAAHPILLLATMVIIVL
jgi:hypothetical protein